MMQPDSERHGGIGVSVENIIGNNDVMNFDMMAEIEKELLNNPYDMISLVFLLYEVPDTALQRLIVFQRVSSDPGSSTNLNMLHDWFQHAKHNPNWKHEFVEALLICQLYSIVRKMGINVPAARKFYQTDSITVKMYVNPMKKALYKLCESINSDNLLKLKKALLTYDTDTTEYDSCELVFLKLLCDKFITINQYHYNKKVLGFKVDVDKLIKIVENLPGLRKLVLEIDMLQESMNDLPKTSVTVATSTPTLHMKVDESRQGAEDQVYDKMSFNDLFEEIAALKLDDKEVFETLKSDRKQLDNDIYEIKSNKKIGTCVIINQVNFYPSKDSIEFTGQNTTLDKRIGSDYDVTTLENTMRSLNFTVISETDLDHKKMMKFIMDVVKNKVTEDDSIFMLCILSHGVRGHVYAADSVKVKIDDIQNMLDSDEAVNIHNIPKLLIVQACQVDEGRHPDLVADSPQSNYVLRKTHFLIYYATAPDLEAYRNEKKGTIFIQMLCAQIKKFANVEHVHDIFTKVNHRVTALCTKIRCAQVPIFQSTLTKKLYLQMPQ
ncbi:hypothetical protein PYW08_004035 [Mythimna loreyi]|uniref:Uncharacterized protein n=1 Tax=Mythimna loreyi TaxID=667449 RepID=A0ACC2QUL8_9NEOP|nr:hypothetical protein PYW08_004035 [Mythimna loreyi]